MTNSNPSEQIVVTSPTSEDRSAFEQQLQQAMQHLQELPADAKETDRARINLDIAEAQNGLGESGKAWGMAREAFDLFIAHEAWQDAVEACEVMYQTQEPANIVALAHGIWLGITYPISPQTTITMLNYMVDETPHDSDGGAVAAVTAHYIADLRADDDQHDDLTFLTRNLVVRTAERHSNIQSQEALDFWMERLELKDPKQFLPKMARVLDIIVDDQWWIDRDALRERLPVN